MRFGLAHLAFLQDVACTCRAELLLPLAVHVAVSRLQVQPKGTSAQTTSTFGSYVGDLDHGLATVLRIWVPVPSGTCPKLGSNFGVELLNAEH